MLTIPEKGFSHSVKKNNVSTGYLADWVEASLLFAESEISISDIVNILIEEQICNEGSQDFAHEIVETGLAEIALRKRRGGIPTEVILEGNRIHTTVGWPTHPIRAFFVMLSLLTIYPEWAKNFFNFSVQGHLFEQVVEEICLALFSGWKVYRTGWSPDNTNDLHKIVKDLCERLHMKGAINLANSINKNKKDDGLDIVCYRNFADKREAVPTYFLQCASGKDWHAKVQTPNPEIWYKYLDSAIKPRTGIVVPFVLEDRDLIDAATRGQAIVLDRLRMLDVVHSNKLRLSNSLSAEIIDWVRIRADNLPLAN